MLQKILFVISLTTIYRCEGGLLPLNPQQQQQQQQHGYNSVIPPFPSFSITGKSENPSLQYLTPKKTQSQPQSPHSLSILQQLQQNQPQPFQLQQNLQSFQQPQETQLINSYGPAPSGLTSIHVGPTTQSPLPPLLQQSVSQQLSTSSRTLNSDQPTSSDTIILQNNKNTNSIEPEIFVPIANATLQAANLLASSLLEATNKNGNINKDFAQINQESLKDMQLLNKTDLVIIKARKTAYFLPNSDSTATVGHLSYGDDLSPEKIQELYKQRNQLPILYTINQFLFIIKPENINLLNKLV